MIKRAAWAAALILGAAAVGPATGHDWSNADDPEISEWYSHLLQPDTGDSCCGEADGYWADVSTYEGGHLYAEITDDRPDCLDLDNGTRQLCRYHENRGARYMVPAGKILTGQQSKGNPTGHTLLFLGRPGYVPSDGAKPTRAVLCYVMSWGG